MSISRFIPVNQFRYHYSLLNDMEKAAYISLLCGLSAFKKEIQLPCSKDLVSKLVNYLCWDIPEIFFIKRHYSVEYQAIFPNSCTIIPEYRFDEKQVVSIINHMDKSISQLLSTIATYPEITKIRAIHDFLSKTDYRDKEAAYTHECAGPLLYQIGVCEGISKSFKYIADRANLNCIVATGENNGESHAWNIIRVGEVFYHIDVTFDTTIGSQKPRYDYFLLSDDEIKLSHQWVTPLPTCPSSINFYKLNNMFFNSRKDLIHYLRTLPKGTERFCFQIPFLSDHDPMQLQRIVEDTIVSNINCGWRPTELIISSNPDRMVFEVDIKRSA